MGTNIDSLLLIHHIFFVLPAPLTTSDLRNSKFIYVSNQMDCHKAKDYCRAHYSDLATIKNTQEAEQLASYDGWIGLHRSNDSNWKWHNDTQPASFVSWDSGEPSTDNSRWCARMSSRKMKSEDHNHNHPFVCMDERLILVQEEKTWEDALLYCRELKENTYQYDLASLPGTDFVQLDGKIITLSKSTNELWVGLRFLAGKWLWVSGEELSSLDLPQCPAQKLLCGALVPSDLKWTTMDCAEKRSFLCRV